MLDIIVNFVCKDIADGNFPNIRLRKSTLPEYVPVTVVIFKHQLHLLNFSLLDIYDNQLINDGQFYCDSGVVSKFISVLDFPTLL